MNRGAILIVGAGLLGCGNLTGDEGVPSPRLLYGRHLDVRLADEARLEGELLAVDSDSLWVMLEGDPFGISLSDVNRIRVQQHQASAGTVLAWTGIGALVTGAAMSAACSSVDGTDGCGGVFIGMAIPWALFGGIAAASVSGSRWRDAAATEADLSRFARYPQGWPDWRPGSVAPAGPPGASRPDGSPPVHRPR